MTFQDDQIRQYLLGDLPESEEREIEIAYFRDPDLLARLELARKDLADDYAATRLSPADREKFERRILATAEGTEQVAIARALRNSAAQGRQHPPPAIDWRWMSLAALITLAIGASIAWRIINGAERPADTAQANQSPARAEQPSPQPPAPESARDQTGPAPEAPGPTSQRPTLVLATLVLTADLERSRGQAPTLLTSTAATHVDLVVPREGLPPGAARARVESVDGTPVWSGSATIPDARAPDPRPRSRVPLSVLPPGDYFFAIESRPPADATTAPRYYFRVRAR
jgi:hypothetical protein